MALHLGHFPSGLLVPASSLFSVPNTIQFLPPPFLPAFFTLHQQVQEILVHFSVFTSTPTSSFKHFLCGIG